MRRTGFTVVGAGLLVAAVATGAVLAALASVAVGAACGACGAVAWRVGRHPARAEG
jgi:hypothetical protein